MFWTHAIFLPSRMIHPSVIVLADKVNHHNIHHIISHFHNLRPHQTDAMQDVACCDAVSPNQCVHSHSHYYRNK